jgi:hypothetical protein
VPREEDGKVFDVERALRPAGGGSAKWCVRWRTRTKPTLTRVIGPGGRRKERGQNARERGASGDRRNKHVGQPITAHTRAIVDAGGQLIF